MLEAQTLCLLVGDLVNRRPRGDTDLQNLCSILVICPQKIRLTQSVPLREWHKAVLYNYLLVNEKPESPVKIYQNIFSLGLSGSSV